MYGKHSYFGTLNVPWIRLMRIPEYWETYNLPKPSDYPATTTAFNLISDEEIKDVVKAMEDGLNTEDSIITEEMVPEGRRVSSYLGTVDVEGEVGKEVLISPYKLDDDVVSVLAFHYTDKNSNPDSNPSSDDKDDNDSSLSTDDEPDITIPDDDEDENTTSNTTIPNDDTEEEVEKEWKLIEDVKIVNGYVYATLDSFSPIAVFAIKRAPYFADDFKTNNRNCGKTYIANGDITTVTQEDGVLYITNSFGIKTKADGLNTIVAGTVDDTDLDSVSVTFVDTSVAVRLYGGSLPSSDDKFVKINKVTINATNTKNIVFRNVPPGNAVDRLDFTLVDSKTSYFGSGESISNGKDVNGDDTDALNLASPSHTREAVFNIINSEIGITYLGGICGRFYTEKSTLNAKGSKFSNYFAAGGSHGKVGEVIIKAEDCFFNQYEAVNRGKVESAKAYFKNCENPHAFAGGDSREGDVDGIIGKSYINCTGGTLNIARGNSNGELLTIETVKEIVEAIKVTPSTVLTYESEDDKILDVLVRQR